MIEKENNFWMKIDALALSESEIRKKNLPEQEIFSIRCPNNSIHGPFLLSQIKDPLQKNPLWRNFTIRPLHKHYWIPLGEHPDFNQRRAARKTLLQSINPQNKNIHLNIKGQTSGPYSFKEVEEKVLARELLPCDLLNPDPTQMLWIRLFEIQYFNPPKNLPDMPHDHFFEKTAKNPKNDEPHHSQTDAIVNLAQLEKKIKSNDNFLTIHKSETIKNFGNKSSFVAIGIILLTVALAASFSLFDQKPNPSHSVKIEKKPFFATKAKKPPRKKIKTRVKSPKPSPEKPLIKTKTRKFFPVKSHTVLPTEYPSEQIHEEEFETPHESTETEYGEEELINAIESSNKKNRNPSSLHGSETLGEIQDYPEEPGNSLIEEDIELFAPELKNSPSPPPANSYDR